MYSYGRREFISEGSRATRLLTTALDLWNGLELSPAAVERIRVGDDVARCNNSWERYSHFFGFDSGRGCGEAHR
jgi:hypothetical protein